MTTSRFIPRPGLCSITFRQLNCAEVVDLTARAGLTGIEWGTDVHLPPGDLVRAREAATLCANAGIATPTIGSYLRCAANDGDALSAVLDTAETVGANRIRVWAGTMGSAKADDTARAQVAVALNRYCEQAAARGISIALEYHPNTLTDTVSSTVALLNEVPHPGLLTYWQPKPDMTYAVAREEIASIAHRLCDLHVFQWVGDKVRRPLIEGRAFWTDVFAAAEALAPRPDTAPRFAFMEFVLDDEPEQLITDAAVLTGICDGTRGT